MRKVEVIPLVLGGTRASNKALWEMDREIRLGLDDWRITEDLFTWSRENNTECVGYEIKKRRSYNT